MHLNKNILSKKGKLTKKSARSFARRDFLACQVDVIVKKWKLKKKTEKKLIEVWMMNKIKINNWKFIPENVLFSFNMNVSDNVKLVF